MTRKQQMIELATRILQTNPEDVWERGRVLGCDDWSAAMDLAREEMERDED